MSKELWYRPHTTDTNEVVVEFICGWLMLIVILYNLELATFALFFPFVLLFIYGLIKNKVFCLFNGLLLQS